MAQELWSDNFTGRWRTIKRSAQEYQNKHGWAFEEFSVLGRRFAYQPDDMRLYQLGHEEGLPELEYVMQPQFELPGIRPQMIVLLPTMACNLRCRYCFEQGCEQRGTMDVETMQAAIDQISDKSRATVAFFGGEPLLAWDRVVQAVAYARRRFLAPSFSLTTNGTLLDGEKAAFLAANGFSLIVSVDGPQELHDAARPMSDGKGGECGSYQKVIAGLEQIARHPQLARRTTLRATFDGAAKKACLVKRVQHLNELLQRYGLGNVSVEPADLSEGCARGGKKVEPGEGLYEEYLDLAEWYAGALKAGREVKFHHFEVRVNRLRHRSPSPSECGAGVGYLAVTPAGELHACHRLGCKVGEVGGGVDMRLQQPWRDNRYYGRNRCLECWLRNICGGGCRLNSLVNNNSIAEPDLLGCWVTEVCTRCAAYILAESANGLN